MNTGVRVATLSLVGLAVLGAAVFGPAGTFGYWQGWLFVAVFFLATIGPTIHFARRDPAALRRRLRSGPLAEPRRVQKIAVSLSFLLLLGMVVLSAFDHRRGWSTVPAVVSVAGAVLIAAGLGLAMAVIAQNSWAASTVTVEPGQPVVSTGLYGRVRHPMYAGDLVMMTGIPLTLGSYWGLLLVVPGLAVLVVRILDEEKLLSAELPGYAEYLQRVRYRLVPRLW